MKLLSLLLFESVDQRRAKVVERLAKLRAQVSSSAVSTAVRYRDTAPNQKAYVEIGELEKELEALDKKIAKKAAEMAAKKKTETQPAA